MSQSRRITPQETFQMIQCGILDLNFPITYGTLLLGNTKAGKTTTAHHLMHQDLEGDYNDKGSIVYKLRGGLNQYMGAKIGDQETVSETQVPNLFTFDKVTEMIGESQRTKEKYLIDCPGYLDTFGCFRVITNRYFHFQVFSKVENIKFIITLNYHDITRTAEGLRQTFKEFLKGFQNLNEIKQKILKATCVMITAVPHDQDLEKLRQRFKGTTLVGEFDKFYIQLRNHLVGSDVLTSKIFMLKAAKLGERSDKNNKILQEMERKTEYWSREKNEDGNVDLKNICISILDYGQNDEKNFNEEMKSLEQFYQSKIAKDLTTFVKIFKEFQTDAGGEEDSRNYIAQILRFNNQMQQQRKQESETCKFLYSKYQNKRRQLKDKLFKPINLFQTLSLETCPQIPIWLCKIKSFFMIERNFVEVLNESREQRNFDGVNRIGKAVKNTLNIYVTLYKIMKDKKEPKDTNYQNIINYAYTIFKTISSFNKLYEIICCQKRKKKSDSLHLMSKHGTSFILIDYPVLIRGLLLNQRRCSIEIFSQILLKLNIRNDLTIRASHEVIKFLVQYQSLINDQDLFVKYQLQSLNPKQIKILNKIIIEKIAKIKTNQFLLKKKEGSLSLDCIKEILETVQQNNQKIYESADNAVDYQILKIQNIQNVQILADCLHKNDKLDLAIQLYDCLGDAHKIFQILNEKNKKRKKENDSIDDLIQYMEMANKYNRTSLAIQKGQQALHFAQDSANLEKTVSIALSLKNICSKKLKPKIFDMIQGKEKPSLNIDIPFQTYDKIERCIPPNK